MDRRRQFLEAALELFAARGVRGASMRDLARRVGVQPGAAYHYFPSKRALLLAVFEDLGYLEQLQAPVDDSVMEVLRAAPPVDVLALLLEVSWEALSQGERWMRLVHAEVSHGDPDAVAVSRRLWDAWGDQLASLVEGAGLARGDGGRRLGEVLRAVIWGGFHEQAVTPWTVDDRRRRAREAAEVLARRIRRPGEPT